MRMIVQTFYTLPKPIDMVPPKRKQAKDSPPFPHASGNKNAGTATLSLCKQRIQMGTQKAIQERICFLIGWRVHNICSHPTNKHTGVSVRACVCACVCSIMAFSNNNNNNKNNKN